MPDSYTNLHYHVVFSTKDPRPLITREHESRLYDYIGGTIRSAGGILFGTQRYRRSRSAPRDRIVRYSMSSETRKRTPTGWMHEVFPSLKDFSWQRGYVASTVSQSNVGEVRKYIAQQKEHHQKVSFRDEFIHFLKANGIEHDER